jgi:SpoIID/LytB domain protein
MCLVLNRSHFRHTLVALLVGGLVAGAVPASGAAAVAGYPATDVTLSGHGFGHGIGMGQWGAFGYAAQYHETFSWILGHYYGGTSPASLGSDPTISVAITENDGGAAVLTSGAAFTVAGHAFKAGTAARMLLVNASNGTFEVDERSSCGSGTWTKVTNAANPVAVPSTESPSATSSQVLTLCRDDGVNEPLRGEVQAVDRGGTPHTVNLVAIEQYLRGVVPSEMPADWGTVGSAGPGGRPWGFQALEAQAVAARSYATAYYTADGGWGGYADICDSGDCQGYEGMLNENPVSDAAVSATAGQILDLSGTRTAATAMYSASTGGYSAGGPFPAVPDAGDAVCLQRDSITCNPSHDWTDSIPVPTVQAAYPSIGTLESVLVTKRNGLGDMGGRVLEVSISGSAGSVTVTGSDFAYTFGLLSNWFAVTNGPGGHQSGLAGYRVATSAGLVRSFGSALDEGSLRSPPAAPIVALVATPRSGSGYWLAGADGAVDHFGTAGSYGSMAGRHLNAAVVGMAATSDGRGYWLVATDGGIFNFGDAHFHGSMGGSHLNKPIVGMAATPDGGGYWLVASDGGIFAFGDARFRGSMGGSHLNEPIVGMARSADGAGYWMVARDGGIFNFGDARFEGSLGGQVLPAPATAMLPTPDGNGYEILTADGAVHPCGDAPQYGDMSGAVPAGSSAVGLAS